MPHPETLAEIAASGRRVMLGCIACKRSVYIEGNEAVRLFGGDRTLDGVREVAKCSRCGARRHSLNVDTVTPPTS